MSVAASRTNLVDLAWKKVHDCLHAIPSKLVGQLLALRLCQPNLNKMSISVQKINNNTALPQLLEIHGISVGLVSVHSILKSRLDVKTGCFEVQQSFPESFFSCDCTYTVRLQLGQLCSIWSSGQEFAFANIGLAARCMKSLSMNASCVESAQANGTCL